MAKELITLSVEDLDKIIESAFKKGEDWGATYSGWFTPRELDHKTKIVDAQLLLLKKARRMSKKNGGGNA